MHILSKTLFHQQYYLDWKELVISSKDGIKLVWQNLFLRRSCWWTLIVFEKSQFDRPLISWVSPVIIFKYWHIRFFQTWNFSCFKTVIINIKCPWGSFASSFTTIGCKLIRHADFKMFTFNKLLCNWLKLKELQYHVMNSCQFCYHHTVTEQ